MRAAIFAFALALAACGGGSKPAAQDPATEETTEENLPDDSNMPVENEHCCCETDESSFEDLSIGDCDAAGGVCSDDYAACQAE